MSAYYYTLIVINMQESKYPRGCAAFVAMFYSCLSGVLNSSKKIGFFNWKHMPLGPFTSVLQNQKAQSEQPWAKAKFISLSL